MTSPELSPTILTPEETQRLQGRVIELQFALISRAADRNGIKDQAAREEYAMTWILENAANLRQMVEADLGLQRLILTDTNAAMDELERRFDALREQKTEKAA